MMLWHLLITLLKWRKLLLITTLLCVIGAVLRVAEGVPQGGLDTYRSVVVDRREANTFLPPAAVGGPLFTRWVRTPANSGNNCPEEWRA